MFRKKRTQFHAYNDSYFYESLFNSLLGGASDGSQHIELDSTGSVTISQTINTIADQEYVISFKYKARPDTAQSTNGLRVTWNGATIVPNSGLVWGSTWQTHKATVTGTGSDVLSFMDAGTSDGLGTFLDDVSVVRLDAVGVPEKALAQDNTPRVTISGPSIAYTGTPVRIYATYENWGADSPTPQILPYPHLPLPLRHWENVRDWFADPHTYPPSYYEFRLGPTLNLVLGTNEISISSGSIRSNILEIELRRAPYTLDVTGATTITHLASLNGDGLRFSVNGDKENIKRIEWKVGKLTGDGSIIPSTIKTYKTVYEECNADLGGSGGCGLSTESRPWWQARLGGGQKLSNTYFKISGQSPGSGGNVWSDVGNDFDVGRHAAFAVITTKDGSTFRTPVEVFTVTSRAVPTILLTHIEHGNYVSFHASASAAGGTGNHISWYVNDVKQTRHANIILDGANNVYVDGDEGLKSTDTHFNFKPPTKPTSHTDPAAVYNVYAKLTYGGAHGTDHEAGRTAVTTLTYNPPSPPENLPEPTGIARHYDYAVLWSDGMFAMRYTTSVPWLDGSNIAIGEKDGSSKVNMAGAYTFVNDRGYGYGHEYTISKSKVCDIDALNDPYVFVMGDSIMHRVGPLYMYEFTSSTCP